MVGDPSQEMRVRLIGAILVFFAVETMINRCRSPSPHKYLPKTNIFERSSFVLFLKDDRMHLILVVETFVVDHLFANGLIG